MNQHNNFTFRDDIDNHTKISFKFDNAIDNLNKSEKNKS